MYERLSLQAKEIRGYEGEEQDFSECWIRDSLLQHAMSLEAFISNNTFGAQGEN